MRLGGCLGGLPLSRTGDVGTQSNKVLVRDGGGTFATAGRKGSVIDSGMNWTFAVDPQEPEVIYTNSGYGSNGLFKSTNGD